MAEAPSCEVALDTGQQFPVKKPAPLNPVGVESERLRVRITSFRRAVLEVVEKRARPRCGDIRVGELVELDVELPRWREPLAFAFGQIMANQLLFGSMDPA